MISGSTPTRYIRLDPDPVDAPAVGGHVIGYRSEQQPAFINREPFPAHHRSGGGLTDHRDVGAPANEIDERLGGADRLPARQQVNVVLGGPIELRAEGLIVQPL